MTNHPNKAEVPKVDVPFPSSSVCPPPLNWKLHIPVAPRFLRPRLVACAGPRLIPTMSRREPPLEAPARHGPSGFLPKEAGDHSIGGQNIRCSSYHII